MMPRSKVRSFAFLATVLLLLASCSGDDGTEGETGPADTGPAETGSTETGPAETGSTEPIRIGALTSLTGNFTPWGLGVRDGMQLAVNEINDAGGVDGRMLELVVVDDESTPEAGTSGFERLLEDGVVAVGGIISSDVALATAVIAEQELLPLFLIKAGAGTILTPDSRYTFRTCLPAAPMVAGPILQYAQSEGLTRVGAIIADYAWGQSIKAALEAEFAQAPDIELQIEVAPIDETDFTTYLRSLEGIDPELIVATGHPPGSGPITVQSADLGFDVPITGAYTPPQLVAGGAGEAAIGRYADFACVDYQSQDYQDLATRFLAFSEDNVFMSDDAVAGYGIVTMVAEAVGEVGDDPAAVAEYLHANTFDLPGYSFEMGWTEWGELANAQIAFTLLGAGPAPEGVNEAGDFYPEPLLISEPLEPYVPEAP
jgi:branched-chain amino acid transport system substrate-binding protein